MTITLNNTEIIRGFVVQGRATYTTQYAEKFRVSIDEDEPISMTPMKISSQMGDDKESPVTINMDNEIDLAGSYQDGIFNLPGVKTANNIVVVLFSTPISGTTIKITPQTSTRRGSMRFDVLI